jgi:hypothetical protein
MTSAHNGEAVLALARELRHAVAARQEAMGNALHAYNHVGGQRLDYAAAFLKASQRADSAYDASSRGALESYRARILEE